MVENKNLEDNQIRVERFEFVLTVNDNIVCQRYFRIGGFRERSLGSVQLTEAVEKCVDVINKDLVEKTNIFNWYMAPQVFSNKEEMDSWIESHRESGIKLDVPSFAVLKDTKEIFNWNGNEMTPWGNKFDTADFDGTKAEQPCILKFSFLENKNEVRSITWDISNICPRFVRSNIDLSNSKNKYEVDGVTKAPIESFLIKKFMRARTSLIPRILNILSTACSSEDASEYTTFLDYGGRKYDLDIANSEEKYIKKVEAEYRAKTNAYFRN